MTKILTALICFLVVCSAKYLGIQDIQSTSIGTRDIQNLQWQWPSGQFSGSLTLTFPRKTYIHSVDVITCCFESSEVEITAMDESGDIPLGPLGDSTKKARAVFTYFVKGDNKEGYASEEILLMKGSQVLLKISGIGSGTEWPDDIPQTLPPHEFSSVPSDLTGLYLILRQQSGDKDDMEFDFAAQIFDHTGASIYSFRWNEKKLTSEDGSSNTIRLDLGAFQSPPQQEHHFFSVEKYANSIEISISVEQIQNLKIQSIIIHSPDCASNQYYDKGCQNCNSLCKSCFGPNTDECFDCVYGKGPTGLTRPYGNCCPEWCQGCDENDYCSSCITATPIYNYWKGDCFRQCKLSEYFDGEDDDKFLPCHERCLSCTWGGPQDCIICRYGRGIEDNLCCPPFCKKCDNANRCTLCMDGYLQFEFQCYKTCPGQLISYDVLKCEQRDVDTRPPVTPRGKLPLN